METFDLEIIGKLHETLKSKGLTLSLAESCTAGLVSHMLTTLPGASKFYDSSIVCYSVESKKKLLGIKESLIKKHGVISEDAARAMAEAVKDRTGTDVSLSVTGNLGPEALEDREVGLVFIAVSTELETTSRGFIFKGSRQEIKHSAATAALHFLYEAVSAWT